MSDIDKDTEIQSVENTITAPVIQQSKEDTPIEKVEKRLTGFVSKALGMVTEDYEFDKKLKDEILNQISAGNINPSQLISLYSNQQVNTNDRITKILSPLVQILVKKQEAELAKANAAATITQTLTSTSNMKEMSLEVTPQILNGLTAFQNMMAALANKSKEDQLQ